MSKRIIIAGLCFSILFVIASSGAEVDVSGDLIITGGGVLKFPDGTVQSTAIMTNSYTYSLATGANALANQIVYGMNHSYSNIAYGNWALGSAVYGQSNIAMGNGALRFNTGGSWNIAVGTNALSNNTYGQGNVAIGDDALTENISGSNNTAIGYEAMYYNISGDYNTAIGGWALSLNENGKRNTATGTYALYTNSSGENNTANGYYALYNNTIGLGNTAIGLEALNTNDEGSANTAVGYQALHSNTTSNNNTAVGNQALFGSTGAGNTALGNLALQGSVTGFNNTAIGYGADVEFDNLSNATAIGYGALVDASDHIRIGNSFVSEIGGNVAWTNLSDMRNKKDVQDISLGLDFISSLRPVEFRMKQGNDRTDLGFIAQDIEALLGTEYNVLGIGGDAERTLSLRYTDFIAPMVKAMQEQQKIIERLNDDLRQMRKELAELKTAR